VHRLGLQATLAYPATHGPGTPPDPLRYLGNRQHVSTLRQRVDEAARPRAEDRLARSIEQAAELAASLQTSRRRSIAVISSSDENPKRDNKKSRSASRTRTQRT